MGGVPFVILAVIMVLAMLAIVAGAYYLIRRW